MSNIFIAFGTLTMINFQESLYELCHLILEWHAHEMAALDFYYHDIIQNHFLVYSDFVKFLRVSNQIREELYLRRF